MCMQMAGSPFNWPFHTSCSMCVPSETTKPCLDVEPTRVGGFARAKRAWTEVTVDNTLLVQLLADHAVQLSLNHIFSRRRPLLVH